MIRYVLRNLTGLVLAGAAVVVVGGTAAGAGTRGDTLNCPGWHPQIEATVAWHAWSPAVDAQPQHGWHPSAPAAAEHGWHPAAPAAPQQDGWHPSAPVAVQRHAWNPVPTTPVACD